MDVPEDDHDIALQRVAGDLLADFDRSLGQYVQGPGPVRVGEATRMTSTLLDPFQEFPQLLDPYLSSWLPKLADVYLASLQAPHRQQTATSPHLEPLTAGICRLLYTFCKVRGEKVVVRFLSVEARYLEVLLAAFEASHEQWAWEERYVVLLWLSHLALAPFDLASMSSLDLNEVGLPDIDNFVWPDSTPPTIAARVVPLAVRYLASPGKERDAAKALLVRLAVRRDMQEIGLLERLVDWALASLGAPGEDKSETAYFYIGVLSFLAGVAESVPNVAAIADTVHSLPSTVLASALARKMAIKVMRCVTVVLLRSPDRDDAATETIERTIGYLLEVAADNDTPVRLAASKALSVVTLQLDPDMAVQVVEAVLEGLNRNVFWTQRRGEQVRDTSAVDPLEWHGLTLALAHLLYRRSPPAQILPDIVEALLLGLSFEKRSTSGGSVGTNIRDAACFGVWALARRYTTEELLAVQHKSHDSSVSTIQLLATDLAVAACLDSAGNIRRGASAALQELIGRHPNTVERGIELVQAVDYHAVALRARAIHDVALSATRLSTCYGSALVEGLLRWRGIGDPNSLIRRAAGASFGAIIAEMTSNPLSNPKISTIQGYQSAMLTLQEARQSLQTRQVDELHGLLLMFSSLLDHLAASQLTVPSLADTIASDITAIANTCATTTYRKPELVAEAASRLIVSSLPLLPNPPPALPATLEHLLPIWLLFQDKDTTSAVAEAAHALLVLSPASDRRRILESWTTVILQTRAGYSAEPQDTGYFFALVAGVRDDIATSSDVDLVCDALCSRWKADHFVETHVAILQALTPSPLLISRPLVFADLVRGGLGDYTLTARGDIGSHVRLKALGATRALWESTSPLPPSLARLVLDVLRLAGEKLDRVRAEARLVLSLTLLEGSRPLFLAPSMSSTAYFSNLLHLTLPVSQTPISFSEPILSSLEAPDAAHALLAGLVVSADTGSEDVVMAARDAMCSFSTAPGALRILCTALVGNLRTRLLSPRENDRVIVPTLEIIAYLIRIGIFSAWDGTTSGEKKVTLRSVCGLAQRAAYKSGNLRKIEACVRVYGSIAGLDTSLDGTQEAKRRLGVLLAHPWPKVRSLVVDELWGALGVFAPIQDDSREYGENGERERQHESELLKGVDWSRAGRETVRAIVRELGLE